MCTSGCSCWCLFSVRDFDSYGLVTERVFFFSFCIWRQPSWLPRPRWTMSEDVTVSDGQISGLEAHECARLLWMGACVGDLFAEIKIIWAGPFVPFFFSSFLARRHPIGVNTADAGACACAQHACAAAGGRGEVQECEIRPWFVEGDNEQSAIFAGWALMCKPQSCYTLSDFNHIKLLFFFLIIPKERLSSHLSAKEVDNRVSLFTSWWKTIPSLPR